MYHVWYKKSKIKPLDLKEQIFFFRKICLSEINFNLKEILYTGKANSLFKFSVEVNQIDYSFPLRKIWVQIFTKLKPGKITRF